MIAPTLIICFKLDKCAQLACAAFIFFSDLKVSENQIIKLSSFRNHEITKEEIFIIKLNFILLNFIPKLVDLKGEID